MGELKFRKASEEDVAAIVGLLADDDLGQGREILSEELDPRYVSAFRAIESDPNQLLVVVEDDGATIGCLQLTFTPGLSRGGMLRGQIEGVRVAASHRAGGVGRALFEWAIEQCRVRGCGLVQLTSDKSRSDAIRFYESLGFEASHEGMKLAL